MYVLGVDAGGTKTHSAIADLKGNILGSGKAGPGNFEKIGLDGAKREILKSINQAIKKAKIKKKEIIFAYYGLSGADRKNDFVILTDMTKEMNVTKNFEIKNDSYVALRSGIKRPYGVVVVAGTGTVAVGRNERGEEYRVGGLGVDFGDWGCGPDIAQSAIISVVRNFEGRGRKTKLTEKILNRFKLKSVDDLIDKYYRKQIPEDELKAIIQIVFKSANEGDKRAKDILKKAGKELGNSAVAVIKRLKMQKSEFELVLAGSIYKGGGELLDSFKKTVKKIAPKANFTIPKLPPVIGAVILAIERCGINVNKKIYKNLRKTFKKT